MTPEQTNQRTTGGGFAIGLVIGLAVSAVFLCLGGVVGWSVIKKRDMEVRKGWNLVPVVVAAVDIAEKTTVTIDMISQRSLPEQFVTSSIVTPDKASYIINQKILVPVQAGDPMLWSHFEATKQPVVLFATRDIPIGAALAEQDTEEREAPEDLVTTSWVRTEDRPKAVGRVVLAPFRRGDPILWTHLKGDGAK